MKFNRTYFTLSIILFSIEVLIAVFLKDGFIRYTVGDFLAAILVYCSIKSVIKISILKAAIITIVISYCIEFLQLANILDILDLRGNYLASLILGSHFSIEDLIAYTLGIICAVLIDVIEKKEAQYRASF